MPTVEERIAYLEGKVEEHSRGHAEIRDGLYHLEQRFTVLNQKVDRFRDELARVLDALHDLDLQVERHSWDVLRKANAIAWAYKLTWYDGVYVALAEVLGFPLVTADEALMRKMRGHSIVLRLKDLALA